MENPFNTLNEKLDNLLLAFENLNQQAKIELPEDDITNVKGAAKILDSTSGTIYNLVHERRIPYHKQGKKLYFFKSELLEWIKNGKHKTRGQIAEDVNNVLSGQKKVTKTEKQIEQINQYNKKKGQRNKEPLNAPSKEQGKDTDFSNIENGK